MSPELISAIISATFSLCSVFVGIGMAKQRSRDAEKELETMSKEVEALRSSLSSSVQQLHARIFECREESLRHAQNYVTRDEFFNSMNEIRTDIKKLLRMVGRKEEALEA